MKRAPYFPLLARVLTWLLLHLLLLGVAFFLFLRWQLGLGLDSLLSGAAGERIGAFGDAVVARVMVEPASRWDEIIQSMAAEKGITAALFRPRGEMEFPKPIPANVHERVRQVLPPPRARRGPPPAPEFRDHPPPHLGEDSPRNAPRVGSRPMFLVRGESGGYWAGVLLEFPAPSGGPRRPELLLLQAERLDGSGMFFELKPWLWAGLAVLGLSIAVWVPFVWSITRYLRHLTAAADSIATGRFQFSLPSRGNDELGNLGRAIESMAARLDHFVSGQKRFLGDAAHELCAPLARIRTALGILETRLAEKDSSLLSSIEADAGELAALVDEILTFSHDTNRKAKFDPVVLEDLIHHVLARESTSLETQVRVPKGLTVVTDATLLGRAIGNLVRNAGIHAGSGAHLEIVASAAAQNVKITVTDNGPGVPAEELRRIFEPFHRLDRARSRETGGSGLGLAIVRSAMEACHGEAHASLAAGGGLRVTLSLPAGSERMGEL